MQSDAAILENSMAVPHKVKKRTTLQSSNCTTRYLPKGYKNTDLKGYMNPNVYSSNIHNSQNMERPQMSINRSVAKEDVVYTHTHTHTHTLEYYTAIKRLNLCHL